MAACQAPGAIYVGRYDGPERALTAPVDHDPRVSVVVITRDRAAGLLQALERLVASPERPRVIVVDNGSTDGTPERVGERFPEVALIGLDANRGAAARNAGVRAARTPYVAFSDDDSWWDPGALGAAADLFDAHPRLAVINGRILVRERAADDPACVEMTRSPLPAVGAQPGHPLLGFVACGAVVRRRAFLEAGGFMPELLIGGEEALLSHDLAAAGWTLSYVPDIVARHHPSRARDRRGRRARTVRNDLWTAWLRRPLRAALRVTAATARSALTDATAARGLGQAAAGLRWIPGRRRADPLRVELMTRALDRARDGRA
jgi:N-acetylglucosaminyl-diphospho-decaprenol L-rhamnosyltransferase